MALNMQQKLFCEYYTMDKETFGNGTASYVKAYDIDANDLAQYNGAKSSAYKLLSKREIMHTIQKILEKHRLNDNFVRLNFAHLIAQNENLVVKRQAIGDYFKYFGTGGFSRNAADAEVQELLNKYS